MNLPIRLLLLAFLCVHASFSIHAAESPTSPTRPVYPLWNGRESVKLYAKRANLPPTKTLDLGSGVSLELTLIPAGTFTMGTPDPPAVDEMYFFTCIWAGEVALAISVGVLLVLAAFVAIRAMRDGRRPQVSLGRALTMAIVAVTGLMGGMYWQRSTRAFEKAKLDYEAALKRYKRSEGSESSGREAPLTQTLYAGKYEMTQARFKWLEEDETLAHEVTLTQAFYIGKYEVKQAQYQQVIGDNPSHLKDPDLPVDSVSWDDATTFCERISEKQGLVLRLPTEAEWEYACRAGSRTNYCTGDAEADLVRVAWYVGNSDVRPHPVGQKAQSVWGVCDVHGNVWELCHDWHEPYRPETVTDPHGPSKGTYRVKRGGCFKSDGVRECSSGYRGLHAPDARTSDTGFRVVMDLTP